MTMSHNIFFTICFAALAAFWSCGHHDDGKDALKHAHAEDSGHPEEAPQSGHSEIVLHREQAERFGLCVDTIHPGTFAEVIRVTGQIIDSPLSASVVTAPTAGVVKFVSGIQQGASVKAGAAVATISASGIAGGDRNTADRAALEAAKRELDRVTPLHQKGIVSTKDYNAALQAYELAKAQFSPSAASGTAKAVSSGVIGDLLVSNGQYVEAGTPIASVSANRRLTLRADVPDRYYSEVARVGNAHIVLPHDGSTVDLASLNGKKVTGESGQRVSPGYIPVYFSFDNKGLTLPRTIVDVYLIGAPRSGVLSVPVTAISEQQGHNFVYVQLDDECYEKVPVTLGASDGVRTEVVSGLKGGETVVSTGSTAVRLAETSGVVPEGHSHSH